MKPYDLLNYNTTKKNVKANFKIDTPSSMQNGLKQKQLRVTKFYINNGYIPQFIPLPILDPDVLNLSYPNSTSVNNVWTINSLNYFVVITNKSTQAKTIIWLAHSTDSKAEPPITPYTNESSYYNDPYYYYYDFKHFLSIIEQAVNVVSPGASCNFTVDNTNNVQLLLSVAFLGANTIEFSDTLLNILPFKCYSSGNPGAKTISFGNLQVVNNNTSYFASSCGLYDTIFPFIELLLVGDKFCVNGTQFYTDLHGAFGINDVMYKHVLLAYNIATNNPMGIYNFYEYFNTYQYAILDFDQDKNVHSNLEISIYLRMKNNVLIQHYLQPDERFSLTFQIENKMR